MKRGKDEGKIVGPMFPRLHVNDAEKGWPKAPPRNKMALYEQLSIPSQRFNHPNNTNTAQGGGNERGLFFSHHSPPMHQSEKQYCQFPNFSTSMAQVERRKKSDEDDFRVPIFVDSFTDKEKLSPSNPSYSNPTLKFPKAKRANVEKNESRNEQNDLRHEQTDIPGNGIDRLKNDDSVQSEVLGENMATLENIYSSYSVMECASEDQNIADNLDNDRESHEDTSSKKIGNLERGDSGVSETSVLDSISGPDITPDDVVAIIGQKRFWKARRAIANQQRVFAVQVFELHRLIKVQKLIAASPHLSLEDLVPIKPSPRKRPALDYPTKPIPNVSKPKDDSDMPSRTKESSAENTLEKSSFSSIQKGLVPSSYKPTAAHSPGPTDQNARSWGFNQPQPHHWLIPVMSPAEGLVYKPYPAPGAASPTCGPMPMSNFPTPVFGVPAPHPQYQFPYPYGMPIMNAPTFSTGSIVQMIRPDFPFQFGANMSIQPRKALPCRREDTEVQASTASSPSERVQGSKASSNVEGRNVLPLFPTSPAQGPSSSSPPATDPVRAPQVIKVVPHNARTATESVARIFRSIQEERKQYDAV